MVDLAKLTVRLEGETSKLTKALEKSNRDLKRFENRATKSAKAARSAFTGVFAGLGAAISARQIFGVVTNFEKLEASLQTVTGSAEAAEVAMSGIQGLAATLPFSISEVTDSFIKLKAFGLDPSRDALTSYANTASATGKSLNQVIEAVADAATGEFERLKEFGIRAKTQGDQVIFTFRGISTTVNKTAADIEGYIKAIGSSDFAGAAALQVDTLGGSFVNLSDQIAIATNELAKSSGFVDFLKKTSTAISEIIAFSRKAEDPLAVVGKRLNELIEDRAELREALKSTGDDDVWSNLFGQLRNVNLEIKSNKAAFDALIKAGKAARNITPGRGDEAAASQPDGDKKAAAKVAVPIDAEKRAARIFTETRTESEKLAAKMVELDALFNDGKGPLTFDTYSRAMFKATDELDALADKTEETTDRMSVFAEQAARNIQDDFAEFLFDPFQEDGLNGMLEGFTQTLRKMASEAAAAKIFESIGGAASGASNPFIAGIGQFFSLASRATGGPLAAGQASIVGEREPEVFIPKTAGNIVPISQLAGNITVNVTPPAGRSSQSPSQVGFEIARALNLATRRNG